MINYLKYGLAFVTGLILTSCETNKWEAHEQKLIDNYIKALGDTTYVQYPSGLYVIELIPGTGNYPVNGDTVYFKYKAAFTDYVQFDSNDPYSVPYKYIVGSFEYVEKGVDEGLHYIREGGTSRLLTPSKLAFGFEGIWNIVPGYTPVLWTIKLESINPGVHLK